MRSELTFYRTVLGHPHTPWLARALLGSAVGYTLLPFDLVPDFIPVLGQLDDLVVVPALVVLAMRLVPADVIIECRLPVAAGPDGDREAPPDSETSPGPGPGVDPPWGRW